MVDRTKLLICIFVSSAALLTPGCGVDQHSRFQMSFLPSTPSAPMLADLAEPPEVPSNPYLADVPAIVTLHPQVPPFPSRGDGLMQKAEQRYQRGRRLYQSKDIENARKQFDQAIDLMLQAADNNPTDHAGFDQRFEKLVDSIHRYDMAGMGAAATQEDARFEKVPLEDILQMTFPVDPKLKDKIQEQLQATVSQLPLSVNDTVAGYIHYFAGRGHKTLIAGLERAGRYRPMIQRILDEEGLPPELIHLAQAESGFIPRAVSRKQATGMWQFVSFRGQEYGLKQTRWLDERLDPEKATRAAARHLRDLYTHFGDWYLAIAGYNCGPNVVDRAVERTGYADFWELRSRAVLPAETTNYVPIILAMTIMDKNAAEYGLDAVSPDPPLEYDTVAMSAPTNLALISDLTDVPLTELSALNPALLKNMAPEGYNLRVPKGTADSLMASLEMIPSGRRDAWRMHKVESGETLAMIGKRYGAAPSAIAAANGIAAGPLAGDRLVIPAVYREPAAARHTVKSRPAARRTLTRSASRPSTARGASATRSATTAKKRGSAAATLRRKPPKSVAHTASNTR